MLQKILMSHAAVASVPEPWVLLPLVYMRRNSNGRAEYGYNQAINAFKRLESDCGESRIDSLMADFVMGIYANYVGEEQYFLDKTPRYYHCLEDIRRIFPQAKFIILTRNPVSVFASSIKAFRRNTMQRLDHMDADFIKGPAKIADFYASHPSDCHHVSYEELVRETSNVVSGICKYLEIPFDEEMITRSFGQTLEGHGDQLGARQYDSIESSDDRWKGVVTTQARKKRFSSMLRQFPEAYLSLAGFDREKLQNEIKEHAVRKVGLVDYYDLLVESGFRLIKKMINHGGMHS